MYRHKPRWLRRRLPTGPTYEKVRMLLRTARLRTVCQEAKCPNIWECFSRQTATFLILGPHCTRGCRFCAVDKGRPRIPDPGEPARVAQTVQDMGLSYVVITSVTRDDLPDGGARFFAKTIEKVRGKTPEASVEVLIPDFQDNAEALETVLQVRPQVLNHNVETVERLYPTVRPQARYHGSLELFKRAKALDPAIPRKSGLMLGLGERAEEVEKTLDDLLNAGCSMLTLGQYLQPSKAHLPVERFVPPEEFHEWKQRALKMGFCQVASGPFVRSSYRAKELRDSLGD